MWAVCFGACSPGIWVPQLSEGEVCCTTSSGFHKLLFEMQLLKLLLLCTHPSPWMGWGNWGHVNLPHVILPLPFCGGLEVHLSSYLGWPAAIKPPRIVYREPGRKLSLSKGLNLVFFQRESSAFHRKVLFWCSRTSVVSKTQVRLLQLVSFSVCWIWCWRYQVSLWSLCPLEPHSAKWDVHGVTEEEKCGTVTASDLNTVIVLSRSYYCTFWTTPWVRGLCLPPPLLLTTYYQ